MLVLAMLFLVCGVSSWSLNKCCPYGQRVGESGCVVENEVSADEDISSWFPLDALVGATTLAPVSKEVLNLTKELVNISVSSVGASVSLVSGYYYVDEKEGGFRVLVDGFSDLHAYVLVRNSKHIGESLKHHVIPISQVCFDATVDSKFILIFRPSLMFIRKCCPLRHFFNVSSGSCQFTNDITDWSPNYRGSIEELAMTTSSTPEMCSHIDKSSNNAYCDSLMDVFPRYQFLVSGHAKVENWELEPEEFCGEKIWDPDEGLLNHNIMYCRKEDAPQSEAVISLSLQKGISGFLIGTSCILIFFTTLLFIALPQMRKKAYDKMAAAHIYSLIIADLLWTFLVLGPTVSVKTAFYVETFMYGFAMSTLFWITAMSAEMAVVFGSSKFLRPNYQDTNKKLALWCIYCYGLPGMYLVFVLSSPSIRNYPSGLPRPSSPCATYEQRHDAYAYYLVAPLISTLLLNVALYLYTVFHLLTAVKQTSDLASKVVNGSAFQFQKQKFIVFTKIFIIMGATSLVEVGLWPWTFEFQNGLLAILSDLMNFTRSIVLFTIYFFHKSTWINLQRRFKFFREGVEASGTSSSRREEISRIRNRAISTVAGNSMSFNVRSYI